MEPTSIRVYVTVATQCLRQSTTTHTATVSHVARPRSSSEGQADPASTPDQRQHDKSAENKTGCGQRPAQGPGFDEFGVDEQAAEHNERQRCCDTKSVLVGAPPEIEMDKTVGRISAQQHRKCKDRQM